MSDLLQILTARGFVHDATPGLAERLAAGPVTAYAGFDPTGPSLHVGHLIPVMGLAWLQRLGGTPIVLVGGGTGMVGDPSGKRTERPILSVEAIDANVGAIQGQLARFLHFEDAPGRGAPGAARMRNNAEWLRELHLLEFLRDTGKHFTVNYMLQKESVKTRMETGISFTEFTYMLIQAYDFWHLFRTERCELQLGGSDQWGNITAGIELIGRREGARAHGLALPLLTTASGSKFGKTESGSVWLDPERTSPYQFYQFWVNTEDADVERYLRFFTFLDLDAIAEAMREHAPAPEQRRAQRLLAWEVTKQVHGAAEADKAAAASAAIFGGASVAAAPDGALDYAALASAMPNVAAQRAELAAGLPVVDALVRAGLASSKGDARRGIEQKGFSVNDAPVTDPTRRLTGDDLRDGRFVLLRKGKKNYAMLVVE
ncbi:MAG TPA: tyrosine--tRNA ligase [Gemmatimonadales bacterium]|nr:tyrosine--tRNA ligase [Gemmatimonadales bacterium]